VRLYVVMTKERHSDAEAYVFSTPEAAVAYARSLVQAYARDPEAVEERQISNWLYYASFGGGDAVWVLERTLDKAPTP
jgi:hypothetical protein